jgi:hypothetical protein
MDSGSIARMAARVEAGGKHALAWRRVLTDEEFQARFWDRMTPEPMSGCWLWERAVSANGYGNICVLKIERRGVHVGAHRVAWAIANGREPDGYVCHRCDVRICCNPDHLWIGSNADNLADMVAKGRSCGGEGNGQARLTEQSVSAIRRAVRDGISTNDLARWFGVGGETVRKAAGGETW